MSVIRECPSGEGHAVFLYGNGTIVPHMDRRGKPCGWNRRLWTEMETLPVFSPEELALLLRVCTWVCGYCADPELWTPADRGQYPDYWHLSAKGGNVQNRCSAWAIHHQIELSRRVAEEKP